MTESPDAERFRKALDVHEGLLGFRWEQKLSPGQPEVTLDLWKLIFEHCFTDIWARPGLETRTRSFLTVSMLIALGSTDELRFHIGTALNVGITREELVEVIIHSTAYCGVPRAAAAIKVASEVFAERQS